MESISLADGLILTVVSMLLVFLVLGAIWLLIELVSKFIGESPMETGHKPAPVSTNLAGKTESLAENEEHKFVAEMMALVLASEDEPDRKFEIVESKRIQ